jgi:transcriptional regulator with XRE-family HTH domain
VTGRVDKHPSPLAATLRELRRRSRLTLRAVEQATGGAVSNVYLSQLENEQRTDPNPRVLVALARVYGVTSTLLFERAGYLTEPDISELDVAFRQVLADPTFQFGTRFQGDLDSEAKRFVIELYQRATGKKLLVDDQYS